MKRAYRYLPKACLKCGKDFRPKWSSEVYCSWHCANECRVRKPVRVKRLLAIGLENKSGVYIIDNLANGRFYIGSSAVIRVRWEQHKSELRKGKHYIHLLQSDWNDYGEIVFRFGVLKVCDESKLLETEQRYLDLLRPWEDRVGYNTSRYA